MGWFTKETEEERSARKAEEALRKAEKSMKKKQKQMAEQMRQEARGAEAVAAQNARDAK